MAALCCFGVMMFSGGSVAIFGYTYVSVKDGPTITSIPVSGMQTINVETDNDAISISYNKTASVQEIKVELNSDLKGICKQDIKEIKLLDAKYDSTAERYIYSNEAGFDTCSGTLIDADAKYYDIARNTLVIKTSEPSGLIFSNSSSLKVILPQGFSLNNLNVSTSSSELDFTGLEENNLPLKNLSIDAKKYNSSFTLGEKMTIGEGGLLTLKSNTGRIYVNSTINGSVLIDSKAGTFRIAKGIGQNLTVKGGTPSVEVGNVSDSDFTAKEKEFDNSAMARVNMIGGDLTIKECTGSPQVRVAGDIGTSHYDSSNEARAYDQGGTVGIFTPGVALYAYNIDNKIITNEQMGTLHVVGAIGIKGAAENDSTISSDSGAVIINQSFAGNLIIVNKKGFVSVKNAYGNVSVTNDSADGTYVNFADGIIKTVTITSTSSVAATTVSNVRSTATINAKGTVNIKIVDFNSSVVNVITTNTVNATINDGLNFKLTTSQRSGDINVVLGAVNHTSLSGTDLKVNDGWKGFEDFVGLESSAGSNALSIKSDTGPINCSLKLTGSN